MPDQRRANAKLLADYFGAADLIFFIEDEVVDTILPAPGWVQTLPDGSTWQKFLFRLKKNGSAADELEYFVGQRSKVVGFSDTTGGYLVLIGSELQAEKVKPVLEMMPVLTMLFKNEHAGLSSQAVVSTAHREAEKAERLTFGLDVARRKLKEALINEEKTAKALRHVISQKDEFMNIVSHELKTPMTSMKGYLQIVKNIVSEQEHQKIHEYISRANKQADKLNNLVSDLLDITKLNAGKLKFSYSYFPMSEVIQDCVEQSSNISDHSIEISLAEDVEVYADRGRLEQVMSNLLSNAIKYSPGKYKIWVKLIDDGDFARIEVRDEGIGIAEENQPYVFDRFFRSENVESKFFGLGLGLYISSEIIKRHHGSIGVISQYGQGSTFWFKVPKGLPNRS